MAVSHIFSNVIADGTNTNIVPPSDWNSVHNQYLTLSGNTIGASTMSGTNIIFQAGSNVTMSANGDKLVFKASDGVTAHSGLTGLDNDQHPRVANALSTTILSGGEITINADPTKFNVAAGVGIIVNNYTDPVNPTRTLLTWGAFTAQTDPYLATDPSTAIGINSSGVIVTTPDVFSDEQRRDIITLGASNHTVGDVIESVDTFPVFGIDSAAQMMDFMVNFGSFGIDGNDYSANSLLTIKRTAGETFAVGGNYATTNKSPNIIISTAETPVADLYYFYQSAPDVWVNDFPVVANIDPDYYDSGTGRVAVPSGKWTVQTIFFYAPWLTTEIQYGQVLYDSMAEAEASLNAAIDINPWIGEWDIFRSWLIIQQGCSDVADSNTAKFIHANHLGLIAFASGGGGGGEVNTASNVGDAGVGVFHSKAGVNLGFKNIATATPIVSISNDTLGSNVKISIVEGQIRHSALSGLGGYDHPQYFATSNSSLMLSAVNFSAGTTSNNLSAITFSNANGVSFGMNGSVMTGSIAAAGGAQTGISGLIAGTQTLTSGTMSFGNSNGISFGIGSGASVTQITATVQTNYLTSQSNQALSAANGSFTFQTATFSNANGISFGTSAGSAITASHNAITSQSNQQMTMFATGNTTQSTTGTNNASSLIFRGEGIASVGVSNGSIVVSVPTGAPSPVNFSAGTTSGNLASVIFSNSNGVSFGLNGATITGSHNGLSTAALSDHSHGNPTLALTNLTGTTASASNGFTLSLSAADPGGGVGATLSSWANNSNFTTAQTAFPSQSTFGVFPMLIPNNLSADYMQFLHSVSFPSTSFASTGNTSYSYQQAQTHRFVLYSRGTGASSMSLQSVTSTSAGVTISIRCSQNATNNISVTHGLSFPVSSGTGSFSTSYAATNSTMQISSTHLTALTGFKLFAIPFAQSFSAGGCWMAYNISTTQTTQQTANMSNVRMLASQIIVPSLNSTVGSFGQANNATIQLMMGIGSFTTVGGATTASMNFSNISSTASHVIPHITFGRIA